MSTRSRKEELLYKKFLQSKTSDECDFCVITPKSPQYVKMDYDFKIIKSNFPYSLWDRQHVKDHLMIVPIRHVASLSELIPAELSNYGNVIAEYEARGYNVYSRAPQTLSKSIVHQHTHLILTTGPLRRYIIYFARPFWRFVK